MLLGQYFHNLDTKQRLCLPSKLKENFVNEVFITLDFDGCLSLYDENNYQKRAQSIQELSDFDQDSRKIKRIFFSNSINLKVDSLGRILIPSFLLEKVNITKEVILVGMNDHVEIWDSQAFRDKEDLSEQEYSDIAQKVMVNSYGK